MLFFVFSLNIVFSQTSSPGAELDPELTGGYEVGVPVEVNGIVREVDTGDVLYTGTLNTIDKNALLASTLANVTETATAVKLFKEVLSLPDSYCDFGDLSLGASFASDIVSVEDGESYEETLRFVVDDECSISFDSKNVVATSVDHESFDRGLFSLIGTQVAGAIDTLPPLSIEDPSTGDILNQDACDHYEGNRARRTGNDSEDPISGEIYSNTRWSLGVTGIVRVEDKELAYRNGNDRRGNPRPSTDTKHDCSPFRTEADIEFDFNNSFQNPFAFVSSYEGECRSWRIGTWGVKLSLWDVHDCDSDISRSRFGASATTQGEYKINKDRNLLIVTLDREDIGHTGLLDSDGNPIIFELDVTGSVRNTFGFGPYKLGYQCRVNDLPNVSLTNLPDDDFVDLYFDGLGWPFSWAAGALTDIDRFRLPKNDSAIDSYLECHVEYNDRFADQTLNRRGPSTAD